jgi:hypothetical protein
VPKLYTIEQAASEDGVLIPALIAIALGSIVVVPAMGYLYKIFKADTFRDDQIPPTVLGLVGTDWYGQAFFLSPSAVTLGATNAIRFVLGAP